MTSNWWHDGPWLIFDLGRVRQVLSFAPLHPGMTEADHILWRQVHDADLTPDFDAVRWLDAEAQRIGQGGAVAMMTSRDLRHLKVSRRGPALCLATVGLGNAERVGHHRAGPVQGYGTINLAILIEDGLTHSAMIEALTIAAEARTTAVIDCGLQLPSGLATGTGTDCIALACDPGPRNHAGLHTDLGRAIGGAVYNAVRQGAAQWIAEHA